MHASINCFCRVGAESGFLALLFCVLFYPRLLLPAFYFLLFLMRGCFWEHVPLHRQYRVGVTQLRLVDRFLAATGVAPLYLTASLLLSLPVNAWSIWPAYARIIICILVLELIFLPRQLARQQAKGAKIRNWKSALHQT